MKKQIVLLISALLLLSLTACINSGEVASSALPGSATVIPTLTADTQTKDTLPTSTSTVTSIPVSTTAIPEKSETPIPTEAITEPPILETATPHTVHSYGKWTVTEAASCTKAGEQARTCTLCGETETQPIKPIDHSYGSWHVTASPTCTATGMREHTCATCGRVEKQTVSAAGHSWSQWNILKAATIHETGSRERFCTVCGKNETETIPIIVPTEAEKKAMALKVAREIADSIEPGTDLERVSQAARIVSAYCSQCVYTTEGKDYRQAYGVFIKGEYSCAGSTRALGMVLECMGYKWEHANENKWAHQWCVLVMDGQIGFADGQIGYVDYGEHPYAERND